MFWRQEYSDLGHPVPGATEERRESRRFRVAASERSLTTTAAWITFGIVLIVGLAGAFVGLSASSYWFDELFTKLGDWRG